MHRARGHVYRQAGFTLIEVLVSIALIGVIVAIFGALAETALLDRDAKNEDIALRIAGSELDTLRAGGYSSLPSSGSFSDPLLSELPNGSGSITVSSYNSTTKEVQVSVSWQSGTLPAEHVALTTLVTQTGGLAL